jgi:hypothetical protein
MNNAPSLPDMRAAMVSQLSEEQKRLVCVWLGLEAIARGSEDVFKLGKDFINLIELEARANQ